MTKKPISFSRKDIEEGQGSFGAYYLELLMSDAWLGQSVPCRRLIDLLEIKNLQHAGFENERLTALRHEVTAFGISKNDLQAARSEAARRGLLAFSGGERTGSRNAAINYRLTFRAVRRPNESGQMVWNEPTHEWKRFSDGSAAAKLPARGPEKGTVTTAVNAEDQNRDDGPQKGTVTPPKCPEKGTVTRENGTVALSGNAAESTRSISASRYPKGDTSIESGQSEPKGREKQRSAAASSSSSSSPPRRGGANAMPADLFDAARDAEADGPAMAAENFAAFWNIWIGRFPPGASRHKRQAESAFLKTAIKVPVGTVLERATEFLAGDAQDHDWRGLHAMPHRWLERLAARPERPPWRPRGPRLIDKIDGELDRIGLSRASASLKLGYKSGRLDEIGSGIWVPTEKTCASILERLRAMEPRKVVPFRRPSREATS